MEYNKALMRVAFFTLSIVISFHEVVAQKNSDCDKLFWKEKRSQKRSSVFSNGQAIKTKYANFYANGRRQIAFLYERSENGQLKMTFASIYIGDGFKNEIILGQNIRVGFIFSDDTNQIFEFTTNPIVENGSVRSNYNSIPLTRGILELLEKKTIVEVQLKNPFNEVGDGVVRTETVNKKQARKINQISSCFMEKVSN